MLALGRMIDFSFERDPFEVTPDPKMVFRHPQFVDALEALERGLGAGKGFLVFTGEVGAGKTTLLRTFLASPHPNLETAVILNSGLSADELLLAIAEDLGLGCGPGYSRKALLDLLQGHLLDAFAAGRRTAVFIDEAQHLDFEALELVRMLSNLETDTDKLIQVVLFGQDPLREMLASPELFQLRSRVAVHRHLRPLEEADTAAYVLHRLASAGPRAPVTFSPAGLRRLHEIARGLPRLINILADGALRIAAAADCMIVDEHHVAAAQGEFADLELDPPRSPLRGLERPAMVAAMRPIAPRESEASAGWNPTPQEHTSGAGEPARRNVAALIAWLLLFAVVVVVGYRGWHARQSAAERIAPATTATESHPNTLSPLASPEPVPTFPEAPADLSSWDPAVVAAFLAASGLHTAFEPQPTELADPTAFAATLGRTLAEIPADSSILRAVGLPALVRLSHNPESSALVRPAPGHDDLAEIHDLAGIRSVPWSRLVLEPGGEALVAVPAGVALDGEESPASVHRLQDALFAAGHYEGPRTEKLDPATIEAIVDFQRVQQIPTTGRADAATILALVRLGVWRP